MNDLNLKNQPGKTQQSDRNDVGHRRGSIAALDPAADAEMNESQLVRAVLDGDKRAAARLWDRYSPIVRGLLYRALGPDEEVEDLAQDAMLGIYRGLSSLKNHASLRSYAFGVTLNIVRMRLRQKKRKRFLVFGHNDMDRHPAPPPDDDARIALSKLYQILDSLSRDARLLFVLRYIEQLEIAQVAEAMGWSVPKTKRRLARTRSLVFFRAKSTDELGAYLHCVKQEQNDG